MKRIIVLALLAIAVVALASCAAPQGEIVELSEGSEEGEATVDADASVDSEEVIESETVFDEIVEESTEEDVAEETEEVSEAEESEEVVEAEEDVAEETALESTGVVVQITDEGFIPYELTIDAGTTVTFENVRVDEYPDEVVMGVRTHRDIQSPELTPGDTWEYTFEVTDDYQFVGMFLTNWDLEITVE